MSQSYERPGGNITGSFYYIPDGGPGRLAVLNDLLPRMTHVGVILNSESPPSIGLAEEIEAAAAKRGLKSTRIGIRGGHEVDPAFGAAKAQGVEGAVAVTGAEMYACRKEFIAAQDKYRIPVVTGSIGYAEMGGIAKFGPEIPGLWKRMAPAVDQLLKGTAKPGDLPLVRLEEFETDINLRTAATFGISVPEAIVNRATRVYR